MLEVNTKQERKKRKTIQKQKFKNKMGGEEKVKVKGEVEKKEETMRR